MKNVSARMNIAAMLAGTMGAMSFAHGFSMPREPKQRKPAPTMVISPPEVIAAWNAAVAARNPQPVAASKLHRKVESARQFKREFYLQKHEGYADKHPAIATRYAF